MKYRVHRLKVKKDSVQEELERFLKPTGRRSPDDSFRMLLQRFNLWAPHQK